MTDSTPDTSCFGRRYTMTMKRPVSLLLILTITMAAAMPAATSDATPRKSPEFTINEPSGQQVLLSSFKGKVVMLEFFFLRSEKCLNMVVTMNKLNADFASR